MKAKIINLLKNRSGVTLIELLVGMVLFTIISLSVSLIFVPTLNLYAKVIDTSELGSLCTTISNEISGELSRAVVPAVVSTGLDSIGFDTAKTTITYSLSNDGQLEKNGRLVLDDKFYKGKRLTLKFDTLINGTNAPYAYRLTVGVSSVKNSVGTSREYIIRPLVLPANQAP